jgi:TolB protein
MKAHSRLFPFLLMILATLAALPAAAQDWVHTGSNLGNERIRIAAADFKPVGTDPQTPAH